MRLSRDSLLALGLVVVLFLVTVAAAFGGAQEPELPPLTVDSAAPDGARALWLWLEASGYPVDRSTGTTFSIPYGTTTILMLEPLIPVGFTEWPVIDAWVENGGTLVIAGSSFASVITMDHYGVTLRRALEVDRGLRWEVPLMVQPPVTTATSVEARAHLSTARNDAVTHLAGEGGAVILSLRDGEGLVILSATAHPFTNAGLKEPGNPELALNMAHAGGLGGLWFDEWHHGLRGGSGEVVGPGQWLQRTPAGRALLYSAAVIFIAAALAGRRFGRAVVPPKDRARRAPLEYITAIANLSRRAGHRRHVLARYHHQLKTALGARYRLSPALEDEEFVSQLKGYNPQLDERALLTLMRRLRAKGVTEGDMVQLAAEVARVTSSQAGGL